VYEKRRLEYRPIDLSDYDWEVRLSDPGTTVSLQGDDSAHLCNASSSTTATSTPAIRQPLHRMISPN